MCGIVGATSNRNVVPILIEGVRRLEYRGYDSTGLAVVDGGDGDTAVLERLVSTARVADLAAQAEAMHLEAFTGISHTRWATHGAPTPDNAHPHLSGGEVAVVHNGIIENYEELRDKLKARGYVVPHPDRHRGHRPPHPCVLARRTRRRPARRRPACDRRVQGRLRHRRHLDARTAAASSARGRAARCSSAWASDDHFLASDASALMPVTRRVVYLEEGDVADVRRDCYTIYDARGPARRAQHASTCSGSSDAVELGPYRHFMQKEIFEQPRAVADTLEDGRDDHAGAVWRRRPRPVLRRGRFGADPRLRHQLLLGPRRQAVDRDRWRRCRCTVEIASEYRYRDSVPQPKSAGRRHLAVGRDRRHPGRAEAREVAGPQAHARHLQRRHQRAWCARPSWCSSRGPGPRSAWPRPRRSPPSSPPCSCWR